jgi:hypothetical protein
MNDVEAVWDRLFLTNGLNQCIRPSLMVDGRDLLPTVERLPNWPVCPHLSIDPRLSVREQGSDNDDSRAGYTWILMTRLELGICSHIAKYMNAPAIRQLERDAVSIHNDHGCSLTLG